MMMTSLNLHKIPSLFKHSGIPDSPPKEGQALIIVGSLSVFGDTGLPEEELERASKMGSEESRARFLAGRRLLRGMISRWGGIDPEAISVAVGAGGKPCLPAEGMPRISIAHSGDLVAVLFANVDCGIDLELAREVATRDLARRFFSPREAALLDGGDTTDLFFRLWCCREAAIKADGRGMASLIAATEVIDSGGEECPVIVQGETWGTFPWVLPGGNHGAAAFREVPRVILWCDLRETIG